MPSRLENSNPSQEHGSDTLPEQRALDEYQMLEVGYLVHPSLVPDGENAKKAFYRSIYDKFIDDNSNKYEKNVLERTEMMENYEDLVRHIASTKTSNDPILDRITAFISNLGESQELQLRERPENGLGAHLEQVKRFSKNVFLREVVNDKGEKDFASAFPNLHSNRDALLLVYAIAPLHDLLKFLGTPNAQVAQDHEILTAKLVREQFVGEQIVLENGETITLDQNDVAFIAAVIGDHENLEKEQGRRDFMSSENPIKKMKGSFFLMDTLTEAFDIIEGKNGKKEFRPIDAALDARFVDLFVRHYDKDRGAKIIRPEWVVETLKDIQAYLEVLQEHEVSFDSVGGVKAFIASLSQKVVLAIAETNMQSEQMQQNNDDIVTRLRLVVEELEKSYAEKPKNKKWQNLITDSYELARAVLEGKQIVFSGGSSNYLDETGVSQRNPRRDSLNSFLNETDIPFFDPQIHSSTHGRNYEYSIDGPVEVSARAIAALKVYELNGLSIGGVTMMELIMDSSANESILFWMDEEFSPELPEDHQQRLEVMKNHVAAAIKAEKSARKYFMRFIKQAKAEDKTVTVEYRQQLPENLENNAVENADDTQELIIPIYPSRLSLDTLIFALGRIMQGKKTKVVFYGISKGQEADISLEERFNVDQMQNQQQVGKAFELVVEVANAARGRLRPYLHESSAITAPNVVQVGSATEAQDVIQQRLND